jgi:outer membrane receptor protein involved in Fe transport
MAGAFYEDVWDWWHYGAKVPGLMSTQAWATANYYAASYGADEVPLPATDEYYTNFFEKTVRQKAVFGELTFDLTEKWSATGGARWFEFDRQEVESNEVPRGLPVFDYDPDVGYFLASPLVSEGKDDDVVMKLATQYRFDDTKMLYALYSEGFRLGGQNSPRAAARGIIPEQYAPDVLENYEAGFKSQWLDNRLLLNVSLFFMEWSDIQLRADASSEDPWWVEGIFNGGKAEQKGIELQAEWQVNERFSFEIGGFLADPEFSESFVTPAGSPVEEGWPMPDSPEEKFWTALEYRVPGFLIQDGEFWTRFSYAYQGEFWNGLDDIRCVNICTDPDDLADAGDQLVPSWSTSTLQFGVSSNSGWDAALIVRNLFDEDAAGYMSGGDYGEFFGDPRFRYRVTPQRPRSVSLSFTKRW